LWVQKDSSDERRNVAGADCKSVCSLLDEIDFTAFDRSDTSGFLSLPQAMEQLASWRKISLRLSSTAAQISIH
jgi:hypothetical protein